LAVDLWRLAYLAVLDFKLDLIAGIELRELERDCL